MTAERLHHENVAIRRVTYIGMAGNTLLAILKMAVGFLAGSISLVADGIHSLSDCLTDIAVILGVYLGSKKPDPEHPYGHGRLETFSTAFIALILMVVGGGMIYTASMNIARMQGVSDYVVTIRSTVIWVALFSVLIKELLYQWTRIVAVKTHSTALYANAWHHRSDAFSSVAVVIGAIAVKFGFSYGDQMAAIVVGLMVIMVGVKVFGGCLHEFSERAVDMQTVQKIEAILASERRVRQWHKLRTRSAGREIFVDLHILVDPDLNITEAHAIADVLERDLHQQIVRPVNVMIHVEPDLPQLRQ